MMMKTILMVMAAVVVPGVASAQLEVRLTVPTVRVRVGPPPVRVEVQPPRQSDDQVWIAGYWARRGTANVWVPGVWTRPPQEGTVWVAGRWTQRNGAWYYEEGHWRRTHAPSEVYTRPQQEEVAVEHSPPPRLVERRPAAPFRGAVWINGYWGWDGSNHRWMAGHWSARQADSVWTPDRWQRSRVRGNGHGNRRGQKAQWVLVPGHWTHR